MAYGFAKSQRTSTWERNIGLLLEIIVAHLTHNQPTHQSPTHQVHRMPGPRLGDQEPGGGGRRGDRKCTVALSTVPAPKKPAVHAETHRLLVFPGFSWRRPLSLCFLPSLSGSCLTDRTCFWWKGTLLSTLAEVGSRVSSVTAALPLPLCTPPL